MNRESETVHYLRQRFSKLKAEGHITEFSVTVTPDAAVVRITKNQTTMEREFKDVDLREAPDRNVARELASGADRLLVSLQTLVRYNERDPWAAPEHCPMGHRFTWDLLPSTIGLVGGEVLDLRCCPGEFEKPCGTSMSRRLPSPARYYLCALDALGNWRRHLDEVDGEKDLLQLVTRTRLALDMLARAASDLEDIVAARKLRVVEQAERLR